MKNVKLPRIAIIGSRGIPANYGGFETFAEEIAIHLLRNYGYQITVVGDADQKKHNNDMQEYQGIKLRYSSFAKGNNAIRFYRDSIQKVIEDHDIIYSCGPAGGLFGLNVHHHNKLLITNPDGLNSRRSKWNWLIQQTFRAFEFTASRLSDWVVCDSQAIEQYIQKGYGCKNTFVAEYGAYENKFLQENDLSENILTKYGLTSNSYHLVVSRLEPENNVDTIISGYQANNRQFPLVIIGNIQETSYVKHLQKLASSQVLFVGGVYDNNELSILRANALSYLHGHSVGGTNPSLLEAMGSRNLCICHDNIFNREVIQETGVFFTDPSSIDKHLTQLEHDPKLFITMRNAALTRIHEYYNWDNMAAKYHNIFSKAFYEKKK